jgi:uncharacterized membrane-anchored protein
MQLEIVTIIFEALMGVALFALVPWAHGMMRAMNAVEARLASVEAKLDERQNQQSMLGELNARMTHLEVQLARIDS